MSTNERKVRQFKANRKDNGKQGKEGLLHKVDKDGKEFIIYDDSWLHSDAGVKPKMK